MRNGGIGRGWYEDDPSAVPITEEEKAIGELFKWMLKSKLDEIWEIRRKKHKEAQDAIKERKQQEDLCEKPENGIKSRKAKKAKLGYCLQCKAQSSG